MSKKSHYCMGMSDAEERLKRCFSNFQTLEAENASLRAQLAVSDRELRRWRGCPACKQDHDSSTDCPPHEVRIKGRAWFHTQARDWEERAKLAEEQLAEMTVAKDRVALQLREKISWSDSEVAKLMDERSQWMNKFELAEARSNRLRDRADIAEVARDLAEVRRDEWKAIATREREEGVQQHLRLAELVTERDQWKGQAEWAWKWLTRWRDGAKRCKSRAVRMGKERDAALARAEAAEGENTMGLKTLATLDAKVGI